MLTIYDGWLTDTYGKTAVQKFSDHLTTLDGFQEMLEVAGILFEPADALNAFIYVCRGRYKEAALSGICCLLLIGDVVGKGGKLALGAGTDIALKMGKDGKKVVEGLEMVYKTTSDGAALLRKNINGALDFLSSGMNRGDSYQLCFAGGGYFGDSGKITFKILDDAGEVTSYTKYMEGIGEGADKGAKEVIEETGKGKKTLYHYTNEKGVKGIVESNQLNPSLKAVNPKDVRYGNGQYLSDIVPGEKTPAQLSKKVINIPYQGRKYNNYIEIDVTGLDVIKGRDGVYVIPNDTPLDLTNRIIRYGPVK